MSDPKPNVWTVDIMRIGFVAGMIMGALLGVGGWWLVTFGEQFRVATGGTMAIAGMGVFIGSFMGHGFQLNAESK